MANLDSFWHGKKVLITGGTSFVGKNLQKLLSRLGAKYYVFGRKDFDLTKREDAEKAFQTGIYDFVIHMAALQAAADWPMYHTGIQFYVNNLIHLNCLEAWRKYQPKAKFIGVGSSCSYPGSKPRLIEEDYDDGPLHESVWSYGFTKKLLSVGIESYKAQYNLRGTTVIFATLYGPEDDFDIKTAHVVGALIAKFCTAKKENAACVEVWGDGSQTRELIYVEDQLKGLLLAAEKYEGVIINMGTGKEHKISELAEMIKKVSKYNGEIIYNTSKFVGVRHKVLDIGRARDLLGWPDQSMHSLEEGLRITAEWFSRNNLKTNL